MFVYERPRVSIALFYGLPTVTLMLSSHST